MSRCFCLCRLLYLYLSFRDFFSSLSFDMCICRLVLRHLVMPFLYHSYCRKTQKRDASNLSPPNQNALRNCRHKYNGKCFSTPYCSLCYLSTLSDSGPVNTTTVLIDNYQMPVLTSCPEGRLPLQFMHILTVQTGLVMRTGE